MVKLEEKRIAAVKQELAQQEKQLKQQPKRLLSIRSRFQNHHWRTAPISTFLRFNKKVQSENYRLHLFGNHARRVAFQPESKISCARIWADANRADNRWSMT